MVYILDSGQKVHFERIKLHNSGPTEDAATPLETGDIALVMDLEPERSIEPINDDLSKPSYKSEQFLSEASNVSLLSRRRHWMNTRLRTELRAGGSRQHYQQFDYSTSETDDEQSEAMLPVPILQSQRTHICLRIHSKTQFWPIPSLTSYCWIASHSFSLTMCSRARRQRNYPHRTVPWSNPWWAPQLRY